MPRNIGPKLIAVIAPLALVLAACGDDISAADVDPDDLAIAESALLTLDDFPEGWESEPPEDEEDDRDDREDVADCVGVDYDDLYDDSNAKAESPTFSSPLDEEVSVSVSVAQDEQWMSDGFEIIKRADYRECTAEKLKELMEDNLDESGGDGELGDVTVNELSFGSYGDETVAMRVTIPVEANGFSLEGTMDSALVRVGRAQTTVTTFSFGGGLTTEEFSEYVDLAVGRLEGALGGAAGDPASQSTTDSAASSDDAADTDDEPAVEIVGFGFGQSDSAARGVVVVTTDQEDVVGDFVTVTTNFLDPKGKIIATEDHIESFSWAGQQLVLPVFLYLDDQPKGTKVASIDPVVSIGDGFGEGPRPPLPVLDSTEIVPAEYGDGYKVSFEFTNDTGEDLASLRVGAVCYDKAGEIVGGDATYPDSAPAGRTIRIDVDDVLLSAKPATCKAYLNYPA